MAYYKTPRKKVSKETIEKMTEKNRKQVRTDHPWGYNNSPSKIESIDLDDGNDKDA